MKASIDHLFQKYLLDHCSEEEIKLLLAHFKTEHEEEDLKTLIAAELKHQEMSVKPVLHDMHQRLDKIYEKVGQHIRNERPAVKLQGRMNWKYLAIAASVAIILSSGLYFYKGLNTNTQPQLVMRNDIGPGKNVATLTLANGKKIVLSDQTNVQLANEAGVDISKTAEGELLYEVTAQDHAKSDQMNVLSTSKGEMYTVSLSDGTKIWLNAASSIRFPVSFAAFKQRRVVLSGEAYFEIAKDKERPFIVQTDDQETEVLGTHFNINSYKDEKATKTTLLEGSLRVTPLNASKGSGEILKPGEASVMIPGRGIKVVPADIRGAMAWKNGFFRFKQLTIDEVMPQLARWYTIEVVYEGKMPDEKFSGAITRNKNISEVLRLLSYTKAVKFKIEGRRITVMK